jgi:hypothetical protein
VFDTSRLGNHPRRVVLDALMNEPGLNRVKFTADSWWRRRGDVMRVGDVDVWLERTDVQHGRLVVYVRQAALHLDATAAYRAALGIVERVTASLDGRDGVRHEGLPAVLGLTPFADVVGWRLTRQAVRRFHSRLGRRFKGWDDRGLEFEGVQHAKFFRCYAKTTQIRLYPSAAYVVDVWKQRCGYRDEDGPVWRVEFSWRGPRLARFAPLDVNALWQESLGMVRLTADSPANREMPLRDRDESRLWKTLRREVIVPPWSLVPVVAPPIVVDRTRRLRQARGTLASALGTLVADPSLNLESLPGAVDALVTELMADAAFAAKVWTSAKRP